MLLILIWIFLCLAPAALEWRPMVNASWAVAPGYVSKTTLEPTTAFGGSSKSKTNTFVDDTRIQYQFEIGDKEYSGEQRSIPQLAFVSKFPTDVRTDFKPGTAVQVRYDISDPQQNASPEICRQYFVTAVAQGGLCAIFGSIILLVWSLVKTLR